MKQKPPFSEDSGFAGYPRMLALAALGGESVEWIDGCKEGYLCSATIGNYGDGRAVAGRRFYRGYRNFRLPPFPPENEERRGAYQGFLTGWRYGAEKSKGRGRLSPSPMKDRWTEMQVRFACEQGFFMLAAGIRRTGGGANFPEEPDRAETVRSVIQRAEIHELQRYRPMIAEGESERAIWRAKIKLGELLQIANFRSPFLYRISPRPRHFR